MDIQTAHDFIARGELRRGSISIPATIVGNYQIHGAKSVRCKVVLETKDRLSDFGDPFDYQTPIELKGRTEESKEIWSPEFQVTQAGTGILGTPSSADRFSLEGVTPFFIEGDLRTFNVSMGSASCIVSITPTALALFRKGYYLPQADGTISRRGEERNGIRWNTTLGEAELIDNYEYANEKVGFENVLVRFQKYQIVLNIPPDHQVTSLKSLFLELKNTLDEPLLMLSLLSRKSVAWYEARAQFVPQMESDDISRVFHDAYARYQQYTGIEFDTGDLQFIVPVDQQALKDGVFQSMLSTYEESPLKDTIRQTMQYLLLSYESGYFEARLGLVYAALESLIDGLSKHHGMTYLMGSSKFNKLSRELEGFIKEKVSDEDVAKEIIGKLPELRRPPIKDRLLKLLEIYKLDKIRTSPDITTMMGEILSRRNIYIHTGVVDLNKHLDDFYLVQELLELWLLTTLGCPDAAINPHAFRKIILAR